MYGSENMNFVKTRSNKVRDDEYTENRDRKRDKTKFKKKRRNTNKNQKKSWYEDD